jgi:hypothetical protein
VHQSKSPAVAKPPKKHHPRSVGSLTGSFELNEVDDLTGIKIIGTFYAHFSTGSFGQKTHKHSCLFCT